VRHFLLISAIGVLCTSGLANTSTRPASYSLSGSLKSDNCYSIESAFNRSEYPNEPFVAVNCIESKVFSEVFFVNDGVETKTLIKAKTRVDLENLKDGSIGGVDCETTLTLIPSHSAVAGDGSLVSIKERWSSSPESVVNCE